MQKSREEYKKARSLEEIIIDQKLLDSLSASAKASRRLRMNMDLRNSFTDGSQRILNALEPGTVMHSSTYGLIRDGRHLAR